MTWWAGKRSAFHPTYLKIAAIARVRNRSDRIGLALRRGRQYVRQTSVFGEGFSVPEAGELVAWSRIMDRQEVLVALNTHGDEDRWAFVMVHAPTHSHGSTMKVLYRSDWSESELKIPPQDQTPAVQYFGGRATVRIDLPPTGMAILV